MNRVKLSVVGVLAASLAVAFSPPAQADGDPFIFWHGQDWGKITGDRETAIPRDGECDGHAVYLFLYEEGTLNYKKVYDNNGCEPGGGKFSVPSYANRGKLCEEQDTGLDSCTGGTPISQW